MSKIWIGIDNGISGTIGIVGNSIEPVFVKTPTKYEQDYTKAKKMVTRLDYSDFMELFSAYDKNDICLCLERPLLNPQRLKASISAVRCHEAELIMIEILGLKHLFLDSKDWQRVMLPKGCKGDDLKKASLDIGNRLFPQFADVKHPDRDGILIAEYARRMNL